MDHDEMKNAMKRATEEIPTHGDGRFILWQADCREALARLDDNSVDAIVTDPPYELGFMGKSWDASGIAYDVDLWREALRVLKPGGHLLAFGGSRTYHRLACAVEDAGFEIRDQIMWVYGSGFPKSLDVSKAIDKANGRTFEDRYALGRHIRERRLALGISVKTVNEWFGYKDGCQHWERQDPHGARVPTVADWCILKEKLSLSDQWDELVARIEAEREVVGTRGGNEFVFAPGENKDAEQRTIDITAPATDAAKQWQGWGTALKPAHEPIVVARKPLEGTVAANVLKWGTGALNIDGTRVDMGDEYDPSKVQRQQNSAGAIDFGASGLIGKEIPTYKPGGRWPANFIHDGSDEVLELFPTTSTWAAKNPKQYDTDSMFGVGGVNFREADSGSAARFFYCAKPGKKERNAGLNLCRCDKLSHTDKQEQSWENEGHQAPHPTGTDQSHGRDTGASTTPPNGDSEWNTFSSGNSTTGQSLQDAKSTTSTTTNSTTESETCNSSPQPNTSASTQGANSAMVNGGSPARSVAKSSASEQTTGTSIGKGGLSMGDADRATSPSSSNQSGGENLWCADCGGLRGGHATVKPIALMRYLIRLVTPPGGVVLDPFAGSGTTMVAALMEGVTSWGCEMTEDYIPIILGRIQWALDEVDSRIEGTL